MKDTSKWIAIYTPKDGEPDYEYVCPFCGGRQENQSVFCPDCGKRCLYGHWVKIQTPVV